MSRKSEIPEKQRIFLNEYLKDLNGKQAAIRAGYSVKSAKVTASRMLTNANLRNELSKRIGEIYDNYKNDQEKIIRELAVVGFSRITDYITIMKEGITIKDSHEIPNELMGAISEVTIADTKDGKRKSIKLHNKIEALKILAQYHRLFEEKTGEPFKFNVIVKRIEQF
ncbi:MAG TPA: terminase small subunit [Melioribacteraceae bacterium]|nr:terminase small subunit [Melioribacteraceae bacterium]